MLQEPNCFQQKMCLTMRGKALARRAIPNLQQRMRGNLSMATITANTLHLPYGHWIHISAASLCHHCRWPMQSMNAVSIFFSSIFVILVAQADRFVCPLVKTGPSEVQLIENGGRGVCALTLQLIGRRGNNTHMHTQ